MIIQRKLFAKSDIVKGALAVGLGGAIGGALLGDSIDKSLGKRKFVKTFDPEKEKVLKNRQIESEKRTIGILEENQKLKKFKNDKYNYLPENDPEYRKNVVLKKHLDDLEKLEKDPKGYAKEVSEDRVSTKKGWAIGSGLGAGIGALGGGLLGKNIDKKIKHPGIVLGTAAAAGIGTYILDKRSKKKAEERLEKKRKEEEERNKRIESQFDAPIHDSWMKRTLSPGQRKYLESEEKDNGKLILDPYIEKLERDNKFHLKNKIIDRDDKDIIDDFKKARDEGRRIIDPLTLGTIGAGLGGGIKSLQQKSRKKFGRGALIGGGIGAGIGIATGIRADRKNNKHNEELIKEALENRKRESETKLKKKR